MPKITKRTVDAVKPEPSKEIVLWDSEISCFGLRVKPSGRKTYIVQYRNPQGRSRRVTLGPHGVLTPIGARKQAIQILAKVKNGVALVRETPS